MPLSAYACIVSSTPGARDWRRNVCVAERRLARHTHTRARRLRPRHAPVRDIPASSRQRPPPPPTSVFDGAHRVPARAHERRRRSIPSRVSCATSPPRTRAHQPRAKVDAAPLARSADNDDNRREPAPRQRRKRASRASCRHGVVVVAAAAAAALTARPLAIRPHHNRKQPLTPSTPPKPPPPPAGPESPRSQRPRSTA